MDQVVAEKDLNNSTTRVRNEIETDPKATIYTGAKRLLEKKALTKWKVHSPGRYMNKVQICNKFICSK